jgi:hypothetical protein
MSSGTASDIAATNSMPGRITAAKAAIPAGITPAPRWVAR